MPPRESVAGGHLKSDSVFPTTVCSFAARGKQKEPHTEKVKEYENLRVLPDL